MDVDPDMAAVMGFEAFGKTKKRKLGPDDDGTSSPRFRTLNSNPSTTGTGFSALELRGRRDPPNTAQPADTNVDDFERKAEAGSEIVGAGGPTTYETLTVRIEQEGGDGTFEATKVPPTLRQGQAKDSCSHRTRVVLPAWTIEHDINDSSTLPSSACLPPKPVSTPAPSTRRASEMGASGEDLQALRKGVRNENGDVVYFLPSFIEDPWKDLQREGI